MSRGYDTDSIVKTAQEKGINPIIPPKKNRKEQRRYDKDFYKIRPIVENGFIQLKQ